MCAPASGTSGRVDESVGAYTITQVDNNVSKTRPTPPIIAAAENGDMELLSKILRDAPDSVNEKSRIGDTPLHAAAGQGQRDVCELLLNKGGRINEKNNGGKTPLHYSAEAGSVETVKLLIDRGADLEAKDKQGKTPLMTAIDHVEVGRPETTETAQLLKRTVSKQDLRSAIIEGNVKQAGAIIESDPKQLSKHPDPGELLLLAVIHQQEAGSPEIIKLLLENGVSPNSPSKSWPELPINRAKNADAAELLLRHGADPNVPNALGLTPFQEAKKYKLKVLEAVLVRFGAHSHKKGSKAKRKPVGPGRGPSQKSKATKPKKKNVE